jgi:hypothetical protein
LLLHFLFFLAFCFEFNYYSLTCDEVFHRRYLQNVRPSFGPCGTIGGARVPRQGEVMPACEHVVAVGYDALLVLLVEEKTPCSL